MSDDDILRSTVDELFFNFRSALLAMIPFADRAMISYRDHDMHRSWEQLAECLFDVFVRNPIEADRSRNNAELRLARYDIDQDDYSRSSWIALDNEPGNYVAVVRFMSRNVPFDTVQVVDVDHATLNAKLARVVPWQDAKFVFFRRFKNAPAEVVRRIEAVE
ncbi:hypothetical protein [Amycolatopsis alkalitolerans]|uniref:Uncharacterized protein n=1 Tax=Amycolatopsis alkalitolerans TaxID=2547244 RepID=A0A5C4LS88_9PSEU|nr:hypothetical protein [Amycolatopsis alkalitolerans]TNC21150.1 hypothetical protein FG385_28815 [Amycolatopsis alkalitolerans]